MRIISLAVDGIQQATEKGLFEWLASQDATLICLQDLRTSAYKLEECQDYVLDGYFSYFLDAPDATKNGVAIYTREMPKAIMYGFGASNGEDMEGRYLQADFERISICSLLAPEAIAGNSSQETKDRFFRDLLSHLTKISHKRRDYFFCGNLNIAHREADVSEPAACEALSGFLPHERQTLGQLYNTIGYADAFRLFNSDRDEFTFWPSGEIGKGCGWRTDLQLISNNLRHSVEYAVTYKAKSFSSHLPVIIDYDIESL